MSRGGRRPHWAPSNDTPAYASGRRGRRRVRVSECWSTLRAEVVYTALLQHDASTVRPGAKGTSTYTLEGREFIAAWEVRQNAVWRQGRVFLRCPRCELACTRLYIPLKDSWLACRRCWGLTYASRTLQNYKDSLWGRGLIARMFGTSQRDWAFDATDQRRAERRQHSENRWKVRRQHL